MKYYLVGIKGTGMSALALYLKSKGYDVVGSDVDKTFFTEFKLKEAGIVINSYDESNITKDYIYIIGLSINKNNVEFKKILDLDLEYYYYNEFIGQFIKERLIAVSGTHGKTTTSYIIKQMADISYIIGCGEGGYYASPYLVLEACEYQNHFHSYEPALLIIQSLDFDHPDFFKSQKELINSYQKMAVQSDIVLINGDDKLSHKIKHPRKYSYGISNNNDFVIKLITTNQDGYTFLLKGEGICKVLKCNLLGLHNLHNYVAGYLALFLLDIKIKKAYNLQFPPRRMTMYQFNHNILVDDYAHHPNEIKSLLDSIKLTYPHYLVKVIFQSHTYSRTFKFKRAFKRVLKQFDEVYLMDVFSSSREKENIKFQKRLDFYFHKYPKYTTSTLSLIDGEDDVVWIFLGAGDANLLIEKLKKIHNQNGEVIMKME